MNQGLRAFKLFTRDKDYIVRDGQVVLIDEFTGRMMAGRRLSDGLTPSDRGQRRDAKSSPKMSPWPALRSRTTSVFTTNWVA